MLTKVFALFIVAAAVAGATSRGTSSSPESPKATEAPSVSCGECCGDNCAACCGDDCGSCCTAKTSCCSPAPSACCK